MQPGQSTATSHLSLDYHISMTDLWAIASDNIRERVTVGAHNSAELDLATHAIVSAIGAYKAEWSGTIQETRWAHGIARELVGQLVHIDLNILTPFIVDNDQPDGGNSGSACRRICDGNSVPDHD